MRELMYEEDIQPTLMQLPKTAVQSMDDHMDKDKCLLILVAAAVKGQ
jgi:hypothetical protein